MVIRLTVAAEDIQLLRLFLEISVDPREDPLYGLMFYLGASRSRDAADNGYWSLGTQAREDSKAKKN